MQNQSRFYLRFLLVIFLFTSFFSNAIAETQVGTVSVTASVLGEKPIVNSFAPTSATNTSTTVLTKIVGRNFDNVYGVSLDDPASTVLAGTIVLESNCDSNGDGCHVLPSSGAGFYQKITGLSVPAGVNPGVYNVLVTTSLGTNLLSDTKFTVNVPVATATPSITNVTPSYISVMAGLNDLVDVNFKITDSDSNVVHFDADSNISIGTVTIDSHTPANKQTTTASAVDGEDVSFRFNSQSVAEQYGTLDIRVGDGGSSSTGNTSFKVVDIFVEPSW